MQLHKAQEHNNAVRWLELGGKPSLATLGSLASAKTLSNFTHSSPTLSMAGHAAMTSAQPIDNNALRPSRATLKVYADVSSHPSNWTANLRCTSAKGWPKKS